jgi:TonB family protein
MLLRVSAGVLMTLALSAQNAPMFEGVTAMNQGKLDDAIAAFRRAIDADPRNVQARLYLGAVYLKKEPRTDSAEFADAAKMAAAEFNAVLGIEPDNLPALESLARLSFAQAQTARSESEKTGHFEQSERWWQRVADVKPGHKEAHYSLGVLQWARVYPAVMQAKAGTSQPVAPGRRIAPGLVPDAAKRALLRGQYGQTIEQGLQHLQRALQLDASYDEAMAYTNLLLRLRADLGETQQDFARDTAEADGWVAKALQTKQRKGGTSSASMIAAPPPPPPGTKQIRVGSNVQAEKLMVNPPPAYPEMARQARIQGVVRYNAVINREGKVAHLTLVSGHPLLVPAATEAVKQWLYKPTLLNGEPVEVVTQIDVNFTLAP